MKKVKMLVYLAVASSIVLGGATTAFAEVDAYTVKDTKTNAIRQYSRAELTKAFMNYNVGVGDSLLYKQFSGDQKENGIHSIHDDSRKYINYDTAKKQFTKQSANGQTFNLNQYLETAEPGETPDYVYNQALKNGKIVNGLNITKDGFNADLSSKDFEEFEDVFVTAKDVAVANGTIKGKLILDSEGAVIVKNVKGQSIKAVAGDIHLEKVEADELEVKGNKEIKIESKEGTNIKNTKVESYAVIDSKAGTLGTVTISVDEKVTKTVELKGTFTQPIVVKTALNLKVDKNAKLDKVEIDTAKGAEVKLSGNIGKVELKSASKVQVAKDAKVEIKATGAAKDAVVNAEKGSKVDLTGDAKPKVTGDGEKDVTTGNSESSSSSSSSSGNRHHHNNNNKPSEPAENKKLDIYIDNIITVIKAMGVVDGNMDVKIGDASTPTKIQITDNDLKNKSLDKLTMSIVDRMLSKERNDKVKTLEGYLKGNTVTDADGHEKTLNQYIADKLSGKPHAESAEAYFRNLDDETFDALKAAIEDNTDTYAELSKILQEIIPFNSTDKNVYVPKLNVKGLTLDRIIITKSNKSITIQTGENFKVNSIKNKLGIESKDMKLSDLNGMNFKFIFKGKTEHTYQFNFGA